MGIYFKNRKDAGQKLGSLLKSYKGALVLGLPRGGIITAKEIAKQIHGKLDLLIVRKVGHPNNPEYAIGAIDESGSFIGNDYELENIDLKWLENAKKREREEAKRRRLEYSNKSFPDLKNKVVILADDGIATGLTITLAAQLARKQGAAKIIVAVPVIPAEVAHRLKQIVDNVIAIEIPSEGEFLGAVGAYYDEFNPVTDNEVKESLKS